MSGDTGRNNWWKRECGGRDLLSVALPLFISTGSLSIMLFADRMFLLWHSAAEMAASMPAGMLHWTMICLPLGVAGYVNTFVAQYYGAGRFERIGAVVWQGLRIGFYSTPLFLCAIPLAPRLFQLAGHEPAVCAYEILYFQTLAFGAGAGVLGETLSAFFTGRGDTRVVMYITVALTLANIALDYAWIFGRWGFPEMGIEGAAWATVVSQWLRVVLFWVVMCSPANVRTYGLLSGRRLDVELLKRLFVFGTPNGLQYLVECGAFALVTLNMGRFGETAMAATSLAFNVNTVAFIPLLGVGVAVSTLVGQQLAKGRPDLASRATWTAVSLAAAYTGVFAVLYVAVPKAFMMGHAMGVDPEEFSAIQDLAAVLLRFVGAYCLFDALQIVLVGAIKGAGDTWFVLGNTTVVSCAAVLAGWIGSRWFAGGLMWWWWVVTAWVAILGLTYLARFLQGKWRTMRVIEREL